MRNKKVKAIRASAFSHGVNLQAEPYRRLKNGQIIASDGRRVYQKLKGR